MSKPPFVALSILSALSTLSALTSFGCAATYDEEAAATDDAPIAAASELDQPGPIEVETVVSARWAVATAGLVNLAHPKARAARLSNESVPIVLAVHVVRHPTKGVFVIDTGAPRGWERGARDNIEGLVAGSFVREIAPVEPLADILARQGKPLAGVFLTHMHFDHVLGLADVQKGTPVFAGPGERDMHGAEKLVFGRAIEELTRGHDLRTLDYGKSRPLGPIGKAIDVFGDGSFYALHVPGHTEGSTAYLARTPKGPVLFAGDCSHTLWGWDNGVEPGLFTGDGPENAKSLAALKRLAAEHPKMRVLVGHETDGVGTGIHPRR